MYCTENMLTKHTEENCALMEYYATHSGNSLVKFRDKLSDPSSTAKSQEFFLLDILALKDWANNLSRNVG